MKLLFNLFCVFFFVVTTVNADEAKTVSIAVSDLAAQGVKESEAAVISEQIRVEFMKSQRIRLIERSQMQEILKEQGFQQTGCTNDACAVEIGQLLGVKNIVIGSVGMAGSYTVLAVRVLDVATGVVVANESIRTKGGIDKVLETGIQTVSSSLIKKIFPETPTSVEQQAKPARAKKDDKKADAKPAADVKAGQKAEVKPSGKKKTVIRNAAIIGGSSAVLVGGGIAAFLFFNNNDEEETPDPNTEPDPNTKITLP
jgi:TolB-like protein